MIPFLVFATFKFFLSYQNMTWKNKGSCKAANLCSGARLAPLIKSRVWILAGVPFSGKKELG